MSELRSVADALAAESLSEMPDARVEEDFAELHRAVERLERERLRRLAEIDRRRMYERDGHLSAASWLVRAFKLSWGAAREDVRMARALDAMPHTSKGLEEGEDLVGGRGADPVELGELSLVQTRYLARVTLQPVHGVLVGADPEGLRAPLIECGQLRQLGKHPEMVETTCHRRGAYRRLMSSTSAATVALVARIRS